MKIHKLKTDPGPFEAMKSGGKNFEIRKNDRDFKVGDELWLFEHDPTANIKPTGRYLLRTVEYILAGPQYNIPDGYVIMALREGRQKAEAVVAEHPAIFIDWMTKNKQVGISYVWVVEGEETDKLRNLEITKIHIL